MFIAENISTAGLGNRLRFTLSAAIAAKDLGRKFGYVWPTGELFGRKFVDLWQYEEEELPEVPKEVPIWDASSEPWKVPNGSFRVKSGNVVTVGGDVNRWEKSLRELSLQPRIEEKVQTVFSEARLGEFQGVQVRASQKSHSNTIASSPISWFERRLDKILHDSDDKIYLSCDDKAAQNLLQRRAPDRIVALDVPSGYNDGAALDKAVVDLYVLAQAKYLIGPHWSSFVELAWALADRRVPLETSQRVKPAEKSRS